MQSETIHPRRRQLMGGAAIGLAARLTLVPPCSALHADFVLGPSSLHAGNFSGRENQEKPTLGSKIIIYFLRSQ